MPAIVVRSRPIGVGIVAVRREERNSARVVVRLAEGVLHLTGQEFHGAAAKRCFYRIAFLMAFRFNFAFLAKRRIWSRSECGRQGCVRVNGPKQLDAPRTDVHRAERALWRDLPFDPSAVLNRVGDASPRIESDYAGRHACQISRSNGVWRVVEDETQQVTPVEVQQVGDGPGTGAIEEYARPSTEDSLAVLGWRVGETNPWSEVVRVVVEIVLPVITHTQGKREVGPHADVVFHKSREHLLQEDEVTVSALHKKRVGLPGLVVSQASEGIRARLIREIVFTAAADVRHVDSEIDRVLPAHIGENICAIEVIFSSPAICLSAPAGE